MYFHSVHGKNIQLSSDNSQATRTNGFCQAITFSNSPLIQLQRITFTVEQSPRSDKSWTGNLRIGLTTRNPSTLLSSELPDFSYPTLLNTDSFWISCIKPSYLKNGNRISLVLDKNNALHLELNYVVKTTLFDNIPHNALKLWLILDVYGSTSMVQFLPSDDTPYEIKKRGLDAVNNFHSACISGGSRSIYKTRLLIVGKENESKNNLIRCLINSNQNNKKLFDKLKVDVSASFKIQINQQSNWQLKSNKLAKNKNHLSHSMGSLCPPNDIQRSNSIDYTNELKQNKQLNNDSRIRFKLDKTNSIESLDQEYFYKNKINSLNNLYETNLNDLNSSLSLSEDSSESLADSDDEDLYQIDEYDELLATLECDQGELGKDPSGRNYKQIALNIYRELYKIKISDKLQPVPSDRVSFVISEGLFEKIALDEFKNSIYNQLKCANILFMFYEQIVFNELKFFKFKHFGSTITVSSAENLDQKIGSLDQDLEEDKNDFIDGETIAPPRKKLSLTISNIVDQTYQVLYSTRSVYLVCFDLTKNFNEIIDSGPFANGQNKMPYIEYIDFLLKSIHAHTAKISETNNSSQQVYDKIKLNQNLVINFKYCSLLPPILIVGTNKNNLSDQEINKKFDFLKEFISNKIYSNHIIEPFISLDDLSNQESYSNDSNIYTLKRLIEMVAFKEPYMGEQQPLKWMKFEKNLDKLKQKGLFYASLSQICELAHEKDIKTQEELTTCLNFFNDLGTIIYYGNANDIFLRNTIILRPFKLIELFNKILYASKPEGIKNTHIRWLELWDKFEKHGILDDRLLDLIWKNVLSQKPGLLGLMKKFDMTCERFIPNDSVSLTREYLVASRAQLKYDLNLDNHIIRFNVKKRPLSEQLSSDSDFLEDVSDFSINSFQKNRMKFDSNNFHVVEFYYDFCGFFSEILFHRVITKASRWTLMKNAADPNTSIRLYLNKARFYLDDKHDFLIEMAPIKYARIKIKIIRIKDENNDFDESPPEPNACAKVRNFMETVLIDLRNIWVKRLKFNACVQCHCEKVCQLHQEKLCSHDDCIHLLNLDECLTNNIVNCEFRRVKTLIYKSWFPTQNISLHKGPVLNAVKCYSDKNMYYEESNLPNWVKNVAKLLIESKDESFKVVQNENDWLALAKLLGYSKSKINYFGQSDNAPLQLICDWIMSSDNTNLTIELLINYLEQIKRDDVIKIINNEREKETVNSSVFISYQWDSQDVVIKIKDHLEKAGFNCFMDIGQIGGGNLLYQKIDEAIRNSKVVVACLTPKFIVSHYCNREMALADLLRKPIVPIMLTTTPWPPPGGMALIFSQLVYVDYFGVGGHGGCGINADREQRNNEILAMVSRHVNPSSYFLMSIDQIKDDKKSKKSFLNNLKKNSKTHSHYNKENDNSDTRFGFVQQNRNNNHPNSTGYNYSNQNSNRNQINPNQLASSNPRCAFCTLL